MSHLFCKSCFYPVSHPLGLSLNEEGICSGCEVHEEKYNLNWTIRAESLMDLVGPYRSNQRKHYDCIIPINGGGDSFYVVHYVKNILKMNPLCVIYNSLYLTRIGHRNLTTLRKIFNVDIHMHTPSRQQVIALTKTTLYHLQSIYWHVHAGTTSLPVKIAIKYNIPLIIWGSHEATEQVGMYKHTDEVEMSRRYRHDHHLMGLEIDDLEKLDPSLKSFNNSIYRYPSYNQILANDVQGIYLSNYVPWNQKTQQELMSKKYNYIGCSNESDFLYNSYEYPHCAFYNGIHDWIKYMKHGYNRTLDYLVRDLRWKRLNQNEAASFLQVYSYQKPKKNIRLFREFMGIKKNSMNYLLDSMKNPLYFDRNSLKSKLFHSIICNHSEVHTENTTLHLKVSDLYTNIKLSSIRDKKPHTLLTGNP